jgi:hypothetical protein
MIATEKIIKNRILFLLEFETFENFTRNIL